MGSTHVATRWWQRVVPVTALAAAVVAAAALLLPGVRDQLALSATHRPQQYAELAFARSPAGTLDVCSGAPGRALASVTVTSHFDERRTFDLVVTAGPAHRDGTVTVDPGQTVVVTQALPGAGRHYDLDVALPDLGQRLHVRCPSSWAGGTS